MELGEILRLDRYPFDYGAMGEELDREAEETVLVENAHFALFFTLYGAVCDSVWIRHSRSPVEVLYGKNQ